MFHSVFQAGLSLSILSLSFVWWFFFFFLVFSLRDFWQIKHIGFPRGLLVKNLPANTGDTREVGSIHGSGRSPRRGHGNPVQYSCLENSMGGEVWWVTVYGITIELDTTEHTDTQSGHSFRELFLEYHLHPFLETKNCYMKFMQFN